MTSQNDPNENPMWRGSWGKTLLFWGILAIVGGFAITFAKGVMGEERVHPGMEPYTPTKLEWLAVELNSTTESFGGGANRVQISVFPIHPDTLLLQARYTENVDRKLLSAAVSIMSEMAKIRAESRGWDSWLKLEEKMEVAR